MHVANSQQNFANVKHADVIAEPAIFSQTIKQLAACTVLKNHVNKYIVLKGCLQGINKGMVKLRKYFLFEFDVFNLFKVDNVRLRDLLQGKHLPGG